MKGKNDTRMNKKITTIITAVGLALAVTFTAVFGGLFYSSDGYGSNYGSNGLSGTLGGSSLSSDNRISAMSKQTSSSGQQYYTSVMNLDETGALNTTGTITDSSNVTRINNNFYNNLIGGQIDYVYFGTNNYATQFNTYASSTAYNTISNTLSTSAIKWRVLAKGDTKYGADTQLSDGSTYNNNVLLFADYQIGSSNYASTMDTNGTNSLNSNYAFWGTSYLRALLNGTDDSGTALKYSKSLTTNSTNTGTTTAFSGSSYYSKIFSSNEISSVRYSAKYRTDDFRDTYTNSDVRPLVTEGVLAASNANGYYLNDATHTTSNSAAAYAKFTSSRVYEETSDYLFLLDYYDINNSAYGFGDPLSSSSVLNNKQTYADKVMATVDKSDATKSYTKDVLGLGSSGTLSTTDRENTVDYYVQNGQSTSLTKYPWYWTDSNATTASYLSTTNTVASVTNYKGSNSTSTPNYSDYYWLRPAGRSTTYGSRALVAGSSGFVTYNSVSGSRGVRPAFNFNPESVIYATAASVAGSNTLSSVTTAANTKNPAYKVYLKKTGGYTNYNTDVSSDADKPQFNITKNAITITKSGLSANTNAIVLLGTKDSNGKATGEVAYMAQGEMKNDSVSINTDGIAVGNYVITVLFTDGAASTVTNGSETISGSYVCEGAIKPAAYSKVYDGNYAGTSATDYSIFSTQYWWDSSLYNSSSDIKVEFKLNGTATTPDQIKDAATYTVTFTLLNSDLKWDDNSTAPVTINFVITPKPLTINLSSNDDLTGSTIDSSSVAFADTGQPPTLRIYYEGINGTIFNACYNSPPNQKGDFKATIMLDDVANNPVNKNYSVDSSVYYKEYSLSATKIAVPTITNYTAGSTTYTGNNYEFELANYDSTHVAISQLAGVSTTTTSSGSTKLVIKDAGTYNIVFVLDTTNNAYAWDDSTGGNATRTTTITIDPKPLELTFGKTDSTWSWANNQTEGVWVTHDGASGDTVELTLSYKDNNDSAGTLTPLSNVAIDSADPNKTVGTVPMLSVGSYTLVAQLATASGNNSNGNYTFTNANNPTEQGFSVVAAAASISGIYWQYTNAKDNTTVQVPVSATTSSTPFEVKYNGYDFTFSINAANMQSQGVKVKEVNGVLQYSGDVTQKNVNSSGYYTVSVVLTAYDSTYSFNDTTYYLNWKITKGVFDLSNVMWGYSSAYTYNGSAQSVTLINLPTGVVADYTSSSQYTNSATNAGKYTAEVQLYADTSYHDNYLDPDPTDNTTYIYNPQNSSQPSTFPWTLVDWEIERATILLRWTGTPITTTDGNGQSFNSPTLYANGDKVEYTYYSDKACGANDLLTNGLADITVTPGTPVDYYVLATVKGAYTVNYVLATTGNNPCSFTVGDNRTAVTVTCSTDAVYDGSGQTPTLSATYQGGIYDIKDLDVTYYASANADPATDTPMSGLPTVVGYYTVAVAINSANDQQFVLFGSSTFPFEITKATLDCSLVAWNYDANNPWEFEKVNGAVTDRTPVLDLSTVPYLQTIVQYSGDYHASAMGSYTVTFNFVNFDSANYNTPINMPVGICSATDWTTGSLNWDIVAHKIIRPAQTIADIAFDRNAHDLVALSNLPSDWQQYISASVTKDGQPFSGTSITDAGSYDITYSFNPDCVKSAVWDLGNGNTSATAYTVSCVLKPVTITFLGWNGNKPPDPILDGTYANVYYSVVYTDANGATVDAAQVQSMTGVALNASLTVPQAMGNNVIIICSAGTISGTGVIGNNTDPTDGHTYSNQEVLDSFSTPFQVFSTNPTQKTRPTVSTPSVEYTGSAIDVTQYLNDFDSAVMNISYVGAKGGTTAKDVDTYTIYIVIDGTQNAEWSTGDPNDTVTLTFDIVKANLDDDDAKWNYDQRYPVLTGVDATLITYEYYDLNGNLISAASMQENNQYNVRAVVNDTNSYQFAGTGASETALKTFTLYPPTAVTIPAFATGADKVKYDGKTHTFVLNVDPTVAAYVEYDASNLTQTEVGTYTITVKLKAGAYAEWSGTDTNGAVVTSTGGTTDDIVLTFEITKATIEVEWDESGKVPTIELPSGIPADLINYIYLDAEGNEVSVGDMVNGSDYTVVANLTDGYSSSYAFDGTSGENPSETFTYIRNTIFGFIEVPADFPVWQLYLIIIGLIIALLETIVGVRNIKKNKKLNEEWAEKFPMDDDDSEKTYSAGGGVAMFAALLALSTSSLMTIIAIAVGVIVLAAFIFMVVSAIKSSKNREEMKSAEKKYKKKKADEEKQRQLDEQKAEQERQEAERIRLEKEEREEQKRQEAERIRQEKEERDEEKRAAKEEREAERARQEKADEQKQMMMMMMMKGGSGGGSSGGGGGGYISGGTTAIPYPVPTYTAPPPQPAPAPAPQPTSSVTDDVVAKVLAAIQPTLQAQQQQMTQQQVKSLEDKIEMQSQQLNQHQQEDKIKALEEQLAKHQQEQQSQQQDGRFKSLEEQFELQRQQLLEQQKLAEQQLQAKQDEERNQAFTKYMLNRSDMSAKEAEDRKEQQTQAQISALEEQIKLQKQLIEQMRVPQSEQPAASDKDSLLLELLQKSLKELSDRQADERTKLFEETLKKQQQLIEELRANNSNTNNADGYSHTIEQLQLMLQKQLEQERQEQENKLAKQQAEFEQKQQELSQKLYEQQVQRQQELQAMQQDQAAQQIKALEAQLAQQKEEQAKLLEQQKLEQEKLLEKQREEQEKKLEELKNQKDQAELLAELRSQREPAKQQDDGTSKLLEQQAKALEQLAKQQAEMQTQQKEQEQERYRQELDRQRKELEQKIQEQAELIKELKAKNSTVPTKDDKTAEILEQHSKTLDKITQQQADLQVQQRANEDAQRQKELEDDKRQRELEDLIKEQSRLLDELRSQSKQPVVTPQQSDDKTAWILERQSRTLEEQGKTLDQIAEQQDKTLEKLAEQQAQQQSELQAQQAKLLEQQLQQLQQAQQASNVAQTQDELKKDYLTKK